MKGITRPRRLQRVVSWLLLLSLLPMVTFFGHWPALALAVPGTGFELRVPFSGSPPAAAAPGGHVHADGSGHDHGGDHEAHCHASMASCGDARVGGAAPVTVLLETVVLLLSGGPWVAVAARGAGGLRPAAAAVDEPPPRHCSLALRPL